MMGDPTSTLTRAPEGRRRMRWGAALLGVGAATAGLAVLGGSPAEAQVPECGGNQAIKVAPYTCQRSTEIDGTVFSVVLSVSDTTATVSYTLDAPRAIDTPLRVRSHEGISSEPNVQDAATVLPPGATTATLSVALQCGQIDVKAVFTGNGDARGRVTAPYVTNANNCAEQVTTTTAQVTTTAPSTTTGSTIPSTSSTPTTPTSAGQVTTTPAQPSTTPAASSAHALPVTGRGSMLAVVSALLLAAGIVLTVAGRSRSSSSS